MRQSNHHGVKGFRRTTPPAVFIGKKLKKGYLKYILLLLLYVGYEFSVYFGLNKLNLFFEFILAYIIPYGVIYILGMLSAKTKRKSYDFIVSGVFLVVFLVTTAIICISAGQFVSLQTAKYPPTIYFISYSLFVGFLLMGILKRSKLKNNWLVTFISRSSLWIYLWHILIIKIVGGLHVTTWPVRYTLIVIGACLITYAQNQLIDYLSQNTKINHNFLRIFRG